MACCWRCHRVWEQRCQRPRVESRPGSRLTLRGKGGPQRALWHVVPHACGARTRTRVRVCRVSRHFNFQDSEMCIHVSCTIASRAAPAVSRPAAAQHRARGATRVGFAKSLPSESPTSRRVGFAKIYRVACSHSVGEPPPTRAGVERLHPGETCGPRPASPCTNSSRRRAASRRRHTTGSAPLELAVVGASIACTAHSCHRC